MEVASEVVREVVMVVAREVASEVAVMDSKDSVEAAAMVKVDSAVDKEVVMGVVSDKVDMVNMVSPAAKFPTLDRQRSANPGRGNLQ